MQLQEGMVLEGKETGITKFGAFVALPDGKSGLVHISEIANTFVNDVHDYVQDGQTVKVKIIGIADDGKINLSMKKAEIPETQNARPSRAPRQYSNSQPRSSHSGPYYNRQSVPHANGPTNDASFEDKLKHFMQESDSRMADNKMYADHRTRRRSR